MGRTIRRLFAIALFAWGIMELVAMVGAVVRPSPEMPHLGERWYYYTAALAVLLPYIGYVLWTKE